MELMGRMGRGNVYLIILYIGGDESNGVNGVDCGELFSRQGKKFFLTGEKNEKGEWGGEGRLNKRISK
jgi:hypothetical protein